MDRIGGGHGRRLADENNKGTSNTLALRGGYQVAVSFTGSVASAPASKPTKLTIGVKPRITRDKGALKQDGRLDALSIAVAFFAERMARDQDEAAEQLRKEALDKELRKLIEACGGRPSKGPKWVRP